MLSKLMLKYVVLAGVVFGLGICLSFAAMLVCKIVPVFFVEAFFSCVVGFLVVDNWTLSKDLEVVEGPLILKENNHLRIIGEMSVENNMLVISNNRLVTCNNLSIETMHWSMLAHKALALNQVGKIQTRKKPRRTVSI